MQGGAGHGLHKLASTRLAPLHGVQDQRRWPPLCVAAALTASWAAALGGLSLRGVGGCATPGLWPTADVGSPG